MTPTDFPRVEAPSTTSDRTTDPSPDDVVRKLRSAPLGELIERLEKSAVISDCGQYRYRLERQVGQTGPVYAFFGINPSTADASLDDATVRKWNGFVRRWGGSRYIVGNVFAFRSTDVKALAKAGDPVGRMNNDYLKQIVAEADVLVPCWGNSGKVPRDLRVYLRWLMLQLVGSGKPVMAFGLSKSGDPLHPLMLGYDTPLRPLNSTGAA